jgi:hypothetical protein
VDYLKEITHGEIKFSPYQEDSFGLDKKACAESIHLIETNHTIYNGAAAGFKTLSYGENNRGWWLYQNVPGFSGACEIMYRWISKHRRFCFTMAKSLFGNPWKVGRVTLISWSLLAALLLLALLLKTLN